jgi:membrane protein YqaA with SNARE-associated domain
MESPEWGHIISVFIASTLKLGIVGLPMAAAFKFSFLKTLLVCGTGGVTGSFVFGYLSEEIIILWNRLMKKLYPNRKKAKVFTRTNRLVVRTKKYFGIMGIAFISPLFLSIPFGSFVAIQLFRDRHKTVLYISISSIMWTVILYFFYNGALGSISNLFK